MPGRGAPAPHSSVVVLPDEQLGTLRRAYDAVGARRRIKLLAGLAVLLVLVAISSRLARDRSGDDVGEVRRVHQLLRPHRHARQRRPASGPTRSSGSGASGNGRLSSARHLLMGYVGTLWGAAFAFVLCFAASRTTGRNPWIRFAALRFLEFCRTVPVLVFALVFVVAFGLGALPARIGARDPHGRRARQALHRDRRERRPQARRGRHGLGRQHARGDPLSASCRRCWRASPPTLCCASRSTCARRP